MNHPDEKAVGAVLKHRTEAGRMEVYALGRRVVTIGTRKGCHIRLKGAGVKPDHACVLFKLGGHEIKNMSRPDLLKLNGKPVSGTMKLGHGDKLAVGGAELVYQISGRSLNSGKASAFFSKPDFKCNETPEAMNLFFAQIDVLSKLLQENDYRQTAVEMVRLIAHIMRCDGVRLLTGDNQKDLSSLAVYPQQAPTERFSATAIRWADSEKKTVLVADIETESRLPVEESMAFKEIRSIICAPLSAKSGSRLGFLYLDRLKGHPPFSQRERDLFEKLRQLFSGLLQNVRQKENQAQSIRILESAVTGTNLIFESGVMKRVVDTALKVASTDVSVLIQGKTGTGKEVLARLIHNNSSRKDAPFLAVNCGAIPENLMESEFFGHVKGAFTGADKTKPGHLVSADGGTLFLDEVGELPHGLQVKLLRTLQENEVTPVGSSHSQAVDVRIISASNREMEKEVAEGRFRQDLFFRLNVIDIALPSLKEREKDVVLLANHLLKQHATRYGLSNKTLSSAAEKAILSYPWPGNIRELQNKIQRAVILSQKSIIFPRDLELDTESGDEPKDVQISSMQAVRESAEKKASMAALKKASGNVSLAARMLQIDRMAFVRLLGRLKIQADDFKN